MNLSPAELVFSGPKEGARRWRSYTVNWERYFFPVATGAAIFIPVDMHPFLLPALLAVVWSLVILMGSVLRLLVGVRSRVVQDVFLPLLTLLLWWAGIAAQRHSYAEAKKFAMAEARVAQHRCDVDGRCPERIDTWLEKPQWGRNLTKVGWSTTYWLEYKRSEDGQSFAIRVRRDIDSGDMIHAGVGSKPAWRTRGDS